MTIAADRAVDASQAALRRATRHLLAQQSPHGWWKGELETNVTIDAEDLFLRHFLGLLEPKVVDGTARWIRARQRPDGSWATYYGGPGDLSTTVEAYVALRLAGDPRDAGHMARAACFVRERGGVEQSRVFTRMWLALLDLWSWAEVPTLPPEQILLPARAPLSVYSFGCWARQTIVALSVVTALKPSAKVGFEIDELRSGALPLAAPEDLWGRAFVVVDKAAHLYGRLPVGVLRRQALRAAERWIVERQERDGSWGGIQPPWVWSIVALRALGYPLDHPVLVRALDGLETFTIVDDDGRRVEACQSPVWDTALSVIALLDAGVDRHDAAIVRACEWLAAQEVGTRGDWAVRRPELPPGGFPFEFANENYPDVDDTAVIILALRRAGHDPSDSAGRGLQWMLGMQSRSGGFGAFDVDNESRLAAKLAFCDFGAVTDPPSSDVTAHVLETLAHDGRAGEDPGARALTWLLRQQERDGSWFGRWGANYIYGTAAVLPALAACGLGDHWSVRAGVRWLEGVQNPGGGFGEDLRSYRDRSWSGRGVSTASQTAWALLGLHAGGVGNGRCRVERRAVARGDAAAERRLGRAVLHGHRLPRRLLSQLPPVPGRVPGDGARPDARRGAVSSLLVLAPLRIEQLALGEHAGSSVLRTGMGPDRARIAAARALAHSAGALAVAGLCAGIDPVLEAGDVLCATELVDEHGVRTAVPGSSLLVAALRRRGLRVHVGPLASTTRILGPAERALRTDGVLAVDMESAWLAAGAGGRPLAVVRVVADIAGRHLADPRMAIAGPRALRSLRRVSGALTEWAGAVAPRTLLLAGPRSFCAGVERAIDIVEIALAQRGAPIYVRKQIVHNEHVVAELEQRGAIFVEELDRVPDEATVVLSAHGVSPAVRRDAAERRLDVIDATCPLVGKVHVEAQRFAADGNTIFLIGHEGHEEVEGTLGEAPESIRLVESLEHAGRVEAADPDRVAYLTQTTLAVDETDEIVARLRARFPALRGPASEDICYATSNRQHAVRVVAREADVVLVAGSETSSNSKRLVEVARREGARAYLVDDETDIDVAWLGDAATVGITAGASAPERIVHRLVAALAALGPVDVEERTQTIETLRFRLPRALAEQ